MEEVREQKQKRKRQNTLSSFFVVVRSVVFFFKNKNIEILMIIRDRSVVVEVANSISESGFVLKCVWEAFWGHPKPIPIANNHDSDFH